MSRAGAARTGLAILTVLALTPASAVSPQGGQARAADCAWQWHSKRVVKHVRRHGRVLRRVQTRHWWSCDPSSSPPALTPQAPSQPLLPPAEPEPIPNRVGVKAAEYLFILSRPSVAAGEVTVELNNQGEDPHNLNLQREGGGEPVLEIAATASQQHRVVQFELPAGTYRLWCSLLEHDEKGMHATLVVGGG